MGCENYIAETDGFSAHEYKFLHGLLNLFFFVVVVLSGKVFCCQREIL